MVSFDSRGMVNKILVLLLEQFPKKAIYFTPLFFYFFVVCSNYDDLWLSCFSFLIDVTRSIIDLSICSDDLFCVYFFIHFPPIKVIYHTVSYSKYRFFVIFFFWFVIFVIIYFDCFLWVTTVVMYMRLLGEF